MWKKLSTKQLLQHPRLIVEEDTVEIAPGETTQYLRYSSGGNGCVIVAVNDSDAVLFVREYSYVLNKAILQLPMGRIEQGETPQVAGDRELQEETDYRATSMTLKGSFYQHHRRSTNKGFVLVASKLVESSLAGDVEEAGIEKVWVPRQEIRGLIERGEIVDADTLSSLMIASIL